MRLEPSAEAWVDAEIDEVCAALHDLTRASACCGEPGLLSSVSPFARSEPRRKKAASRTRHRTLPASRRFVLPGVAVVDPGTSRSRGDLLVADGRIVDLVAGEGARPEGFEVLEAYRGAFVTPSLVDMHGHLPPDNALGLTGLFLLLHLAHGVTTVRDAGDVDGTATPAARSGIADGRFIGPRILAAGPFVTKGRARWPNSVILDGPDDADAIARLLRESGMQCMKIYENLDSHDIGRLERAAREQGLLTLGHVPTKLGFEEAPLLDAQHLFGVPPPASLPRDHVLDRGAHWHAVDVARVDVIVRSAVEDRRANTPTLVTTDRLIAAGDEGVLDDAATRLLPRLYRDVVWHPRLGLPAYRGPSAARTARLRDAAKKKLVLVERLFREGAPLRLGTDVQQPFVVPGAAMHREMQLFVDAGIPPADVFRLATREAALACGLHDLGTTRRGATADFLVLERDPTVDIGALSSIRAVVHRGSLFAQADLQREIEDDLFVRDRAFERISSSVLARLTLWRAARRFVG